MIMFCFPVLAWKFSLKSGNFPEINEKKEVQKFPKMSLNSDFSLSLSCSDGPNLLLYTPNLLCWQKNVGPAGCFNPLVWNIKSVNVF
jgi:hypothetical protein